MAPASVLGAELAHELALLSVRRWRCARAETALLHGQTRHAAAEFDRARAEQADRLVEAIEAQPRASRRALLAMPEGVDRLAAELAMLRAELVGPAPAWTQGHHQRLDALFGFRLGDLPWGRPTRFSRAVLGDFAAIGAAEVAHLAEPDERWTWAAVQLIGAIDAEIARVRVHGARLDRRAIAEDRLAVADAVLGDVGRDAEVARRYGSAAGRDFARTLRDFARAESLVPADPEPEVDMTPEVTATDGSWVGWHPTPQLAESPALDCSAAAPGATPEAATAVQAEATLGDDASIASIAAPGPASANNPLPEPAAPVAVELVTGSSERKSLTSRCMGFVIGFVWRGRFARPAAGRPAPPDRLHARSLAGAVGRGVRNRP